MTNIFNKFITLILLLNLTCCTYSKNHNVNNFNNSSEANNQTQADIYYDEYTKTNDYNKLLKAADLYKSINLEKAIELYDILKRNKSYELYACESLVFCYLGIDNIFAAKQLVNYIFSIDATRYKPLNALALVLALTDDHESAIAYFDLALAINKSPIVLNNKALTLAFIGREKEAIYVIDEADSMAKNHQSSMTIAMNRALIYGLNNMMDEAHDILEPYLNESQIYNNIALYALLREDTQKAKNYLRKALDSDNHYQKAEHNLDLLN